MLDLQKSGLIPEEYGTFWPHMGAQKQSKSLSKIVPNWTRLSPPQKGHYYGQNAL